MIDLKSLNRIVLGAVSLAFSLQPLGGAALADDRVNAQQNKALAAVAKMMEGQRTYYQKNGRFQANASRVQRDFSLEIPASFDYAIRTTTYSAYSYIIPNQPAYKGQLKAYVGAVFMTPGQNPKMITIICQNTQPGQIRPADPALVLGTNTPNPNGSIVQCGNFSTQVSASVVNE